MYQKSKIQTGGAERGIVAYQSILSSTPLSARHKTKEQKNMSKNYLLIPSLALLITLILLVFTTCFAYAGTIDNKLINAIIQVESNGNPNAYNKNSGCIGLMQINPKGALKEYIIYEELQMTSLTPNEKPLVAVYTKEDLFDPHKNITVGTWYINRLANHYLNNKDVNESHLFDLKGKYYQMAGIGKFVNNNSEGYFSHWDFRRYVDLSKYSIENWEEWELCLILAAYNGGIGRLKKCDYDINKMPKETRDYVRKVMKIYKQ